ncbi:MAG TPA: VOC family protein [Acidimicrobiia bacterium]|nr:VOC family protein [Acidimicrobiia bacterium]
MVESLSSSEFERAHDLPDWRILLNRVEAVFRAGSFSAASDLVGAIATAADAADHHPDIGVRYPDRVHVVLATHAAGPAGPGWALTERDADLAATISRLAAERGATSEPLASQSVEIAIDAMDIDLVRPFWQAVLGYEPVAVDPRATVRDLVDPSRTGSPLWFQQMDEPRSQRNRIHIDVTVPHDVAEDRVQAAIAAGGTLLTDRYAKAYWVLADPEGNEACVCTWQDRD